jgi:hypothetical protein
MALNPNGPDDRHTTHSYTPPLGVAHVIWMGFFYLPGLNKAVDYGTQELTKVCKAAKVDCHFADPRDLDIPRGWDGVHPTDEGYKMLAERIWEVKTDNNIPI